MAHPSHMEQLFGKTTMGLLSPFATGPLLDRRVAGTIRKEGALHSQRFMRRSEHRHARMFAVVQ